MTDDQAVPLPDDAMSPQVSGDPGQLSVEDEYDAWLDESPLSLLLQSIADECWRDIAYGAARASYAAGRAQGAATERERILAALREFLPQYVGSVVHGRTLLGDPIYAAGPLAFPDALVDTFVLMSTPDADLLDGQP